MMMGLEELVGPDRLLILGGIVPTLGKYEEGPGMPLADAAWGFHHQMVSARELVEVAVHHLATGDVLPDWAFKTACLLRDESWRVRDLAPPLEDLNPTERDAVQQRWRYRVARLIFQDRNSLQRPEHNLHALVDALGYPDDMKGLVPHRAPDGRSLYQAWEAWLDQERSRLGLGQGHRPGSTRS